MISGQYSKRDGEKFKSIRSVTLFSHNTQDIKAIACQMRFDEVTVKYGEFGDFYIGLQLSLDELFRRVRM